MNMRVERYQLDASFNSLSICISVFKQNKHRIEHLELFYDSQSLEYVVDSNNLFGILTHSKIVFRLARERMRNSIKTCYRKHNKVETYVELKFCAKYLQYNYKKYCSAREVKHKINSKKEKN